MDIMLGKLIDQLDRPEVAHGLLRVLDPQVLANIERRASSLSMTTIDFAAGAVREFVDHADDDLWFQLLTIMRKSDDPSLAAINTILAWTVSDR